MKIKWGRRNGAKRDSRSGGRPSQKYVEKIHLLERGYLE
jgi:hypothetical protein